MLNLKGQRFGRLTVSYEAGRTPTNSVLWMTRCDCGRFQRVRAGNLTSGNTRSCGCFHRDRMRESNSTHPRRKRANA